MKLTCIIIAVLSITSSALPAKGKNKDKKGVKVKPETRKSAAEAVATHGSHSSALGPSKLYTPGSLCTESHAQYIGKKMGFPRCKSALIRKQKRLIANNYGVEELEWNSFSFSHVIPLELGGSDDIDNIWIASKSDASYVEVSRIAHDAYKSLQKNELTQFEAIKSVFDVLNRFASLPLTFIRVYNFHGDQAYYITSIVSKAPKTNTKKGRVTEVEPEDLDAIRAQEQQTQHLLTKIPESNIGYQALLSMGWNPDESLGNDNKGITTPILPKHRKPDCKNGIGFKKVKTGTEKKDEPCTLKLSDFVSAGVRKSDSTEQESVTDHAGVRKSEIAAQEIYTVDKLMIDIDEITSMLASQRLSDDSAVDIEVDEEDSSDVMDVDPVSVQKWTPLCKRHI